MFVLQRNSEESSLVAFNSGAISGLVHHVTLMYFLLGQTNDLRFVDGEDNAPSCTAVCDCCAGGL